MPSSDAYEILAERRSSSLSRDFLPHERPVRGHHAIKHIELIRALSVASLGASVSEVINTFCKTQTEDYVFAREQLNDPRLAKAFRVKYGVDPSDENFPTSLPDDYLGDDPELFTQARAQDYLDLFRGPDTDRVILGQFKDGMCKSCIFGNGAGGLHCSHMDFLKESLKIESFLEHVQEYMNTLNTRRGSSVSEHEVEVKETRFTPPEIWTAYDEGSLVRYTREREIHEMTMPLGLYRDVITWRGTEGKYLTYQGFMKAKGLLA